MAEKHKQQVVLRPPRAEPGPNGAYLQEEAQRLLQSYLSGNTGNLTEEDRKVLHMVRLVVAELETRQWEKTKTGHPQAALLGSQVIQFALAVRSAIQGVSVKGQRNIYKERLSTEALGAGRQDAGEQVESKVGRIPSAFLKNLSSMLEPCLRHIVAPGSRSVLTILDDGIQAQTPVRIREVHRAPTHPAGTILVDDDDPFAHASEGDKEFLRSIKSILEEQRGNKIHFSALIERIRGREVQVPVSFRRQNNWRWLRDMLDEWQSVFKVHPSNSSNPEIKLETGGR